VKQSGNIANDRADFPLMSHLYKGEESPCFLVLGELWIKADTKMLEQPHVSCVYSLSSKIVDLNRFPWRVAPRAPRRHHGWSDRLHMSPSGMELKGSGITSIRKGALLIKERADRMETCTVRDLKMCHMY
jgi:hypothetical protein